MTEQRFHSDYLTLAESLYRIAYYILESEAEAEDAVQELYLKLWKMRDSLDLVANPGAYGALLVRNLCIDRIRRARPSEPLEDDLPGKPPPDEALMLRETLGTLFQAMEKLPESQRKILKMHLLQGMTYDEIAAATGLTPLNLRVQVSLARKKLKQYEKA
jgi:RNA polymerase sigma-70 factor (ECF subfamily)